MGFLRKATPVGVLAALIACGGNGTVSNAAHLRFFNALSDVTNNARLYVGGHLYEVNGSASLNDGDGGSYEDVPSGSSQTLVLNDYTDQNSTVHTGSLASLSSQNLTQGLNYTAVALLAGTTKEIVLYSDNSVLTSGDAYFRVIDAYSATTPVYLQLRSKLTGSLVYQTNTNASLAVGGSTGVQFFATSETGSVDYTLTVYSDNGFTEPVGSTTLSLTAGKSVTTLLYAKTSGTGLQFKSSTDVNEAPTTTTSTTGTTATTATTSTTATTATTSTATTGTTATNATTGSAPGTSSGASTSG